MQGGSWEVGSSGEADRANLDQGQALIDFCADTDEHAQVSHLREQSQT